MDNKEKANQEDLDNLLREMDDVDNEKTKAIIVTEAEFEVIKEIKRMQDLMQNTRPKRNTNENISITPMYSNDPEMEKDYRDDYNRWVNDMTNDISYNQE